MGSLYKSALGGVVLKAALANARFLLRFPISFSPQTRMSLRSTPQLVVAFATILPTA